MPRRRGPITKIEGEIYEGSGLVLLLVAGIAIALIIAMTAPAAGLVVLGVGLVIGISSALRPSGPQPEEISSSKPGSRADYSKLRTKPDFYRSKDWYEALDYPPEERERIIQLRSECVAKFKRDNNR